MASTTKTQLDLSGDSALKTNQIDVNGKMIQLVPGMNLTAKSRPGSGG